MKTTARRATAAIAISLGLLLAPALTGCGVAEGLIEQATGGAVDLGGAAVPDDFPSEVPLISGDIVYGLGINGDNGDKAWNVTVKVDGVDAFEQISSDLEDAGFAAQTTQSDESGAAAGGAFIGENYGVVVAVSGDDSAGWVANYTVSEINN